MPKPDLKARLRDVTTEPGVYIMKDNLGSTIYVGKARNLRRRLTSYFRPSRQTLANVKNRALIESIYDFETFTVRNEQEALLLESKLIKNYRPLFNIRLRDDKRYLMIRCQSDSSCPRIETVRIRKNDGATYFGPFPDSTAVHSTVKWLNEKFHLRTCLFRNPGEKEHRHCHADRLQFCSAPCVFSISPEEYKQNFEAALNILKAKDKRNVIAELTQEMATAAEALNFERAAELRDIISNLEKILEPARRFVGGYGLPSTVKPLEDLAELGKALGLSGPPQIMECFDISNVSSNHIVASMVRFQDGVSHNKAYRRYRITSVSGQNDFASMAEVIRRRYSHILRENLNELVGDEASELSHVQILEKLRKENRSPLICPDLIIVDGGKGQLSYACEELAKLGLSEIPIIGLAKKREEIFFPKKSEPLVLSHDTGALKLLQRIRDEAHRFANSYNELLLRRRMNESLLDEIPGMSPRRKEKLLSKFHSISNIRKASLKDIESLNGFSEKFAQTVIDFLSKRKN